MAAGLATALQVHAVDIFKANVNGAANPLNLGSSWFTNSPPTPNIPGAGDTAVWSATTGNPTANNSTNALGADASWLGIRLDNPRGSPTDIFGANLLTLGASGITNTSTTTGRGDLSLRCGVVLGASQSWDPLNRTFYIAGQLSGAAGADLSIFGNSGTVRLMVSNTFNGQVFHNGGTLFLDNNYAMGNSTNLAVSSTYNGGSGFNAGTLVSLSGVSIPSTVSLSLTGGLTGPVSSTLNCASGTGTWNGPITLNGDGTIVLNNAGFALNLPGNITGAGFTGSLHIRGAGTTTLGGTVNLGSAEFRKRDNGGRVTINSSGNTWGRTTLLLGSLILGADNALPLTTVITNETSTGAATLDLAGRSQTVAGISMNPAVVGTIAVTNSSASTDSALTLVGPGVFPFGGLILDGSRKVALTVNNCTLLLSGANTYSGPTAVGSGGKLVVSTTQTGGGTFTVDDGCTLGIKVTAGASLNTASLTLGSSTLGATNEFTLSGNPTAPVVNATALTNHGSVTVNIAGAGLSVGQFALIDYSGSIGGDGYTFVLGTTPVGVSANLVNNTANSSVDLNITAAPGFIWTGQVNGDWDIGVTTNWVDTTASQPAVYTDGLSARFDDTATGTTIINLATNVSPGGVVVSNITLTYSLGGTNGILGSGGLTKQGAGTLIVSNSANGYTGDTTISGGTYQLGATGMIPNGAGRGNVTLNATLDLAGFNETVNGLTGSGTADNTASATTSTLSAGDNNAASTFSGALMNSGGTLAFAKVGGGALTLSGANSHSGGTTITAGTLRLGSAGALGSGLVTLNGGRISSDGGTARAITNAVAVTASSSLGDASNPGLLTFSGSVDLSAGTQKDFTVSSEVALTGTMGNGSFAKLGPAALRVENGGVVTLSADLATRDGTIVLNNATFNQAYGQFRLNCNVPSGLVRVVVSNSASVTVSTDQLRVGHSNGDATATNLLEIAATVDLQATDSDNGKVEMGSKSARAILNLRTNGLLRTRGVEHLTTSPFVSVSEFNFDGGTLQPNAGPNAAAFMQGLTVANVLAGGAIIDTAGAGNAIRIGQSLLNGGGNGGLVKLGGGKLSLNGTNTYTGSTVVSNGIFGGNGVISGPVQVNEFAELAPGSALSGIGTLTVNNSVTLAANATCTMELNRGSVPACDKLVANTINASGLLVVANIGGTLLSGDSLDLFDATTLNLTFSSVTLPPLLAGLSWDTNQLAANGIIQVTGTAVPPQITSAVLSGTDLLMSGSGGVPGVKYYVLAATNVALPMTNWTSIATDLFDGIGNFVFTSSTADPGTPQRFLRLQLP
jgi:fibronectin-binding autotransporter adhesin